MASVLTALAPTLFSAAQEVSAEPFGAIAAINSSFSDKGVAKGDSVKIPYAPVQANTNFAAANVTPEGTSVTAGAISVTIDKSQKNSMVLTGEQIRSLENGGNYQEWVRQWALQAMRALRNEAEQDCALAIKKGASRAVGVAATTPFATDMDLIVDVRALLRANGTPFADAQLVLSPAAVANLQKLGTFQLAYAAGSDAERRSGLMGRQFGFGLRDSAGIAKHVKGTATGFDVNLGGGYAIGDKTIVVDGSDSGTILAGDVVTWAGDTNKYVIDSASASGAAAGNIVLNRPGLRATLADTVEGTLGADYTPCLAFERNAVVGIMRPPLMPANPTINQMLISDSFGMTYLMLDIAQYGQRSFEMHLAWGFKTVQSEHVALILG